MNLHDWPAIGTEGEFINAKGKTQRCVVVGHSEAMHALRVRYVDGRRRSATVLYIAPDELLPQGPRNTPAKP